MKINKHSVLSIRKGSTQRGATLIEAMVSLFVFAVGALGIAAMQTTSLVRGDDTKQRSLAIWKAQELADRMRVTKTPTNPQGLIKKYVEKIANTNDDNGIGKVSASDVYSCPTTTPTRCDDIDGTAASACDEDELIEFDLWSIMCDPNSGISGSKNDGAIGLRDVELAADFKVIDAGTEDEKNEVWVYLEWANRDSSNNEKLQNTNKEIKTELCGVEKNVDARLDAYCLRFQ